MRKAMFCAAAALFAWLALASGAEAREECGVHAFPIDLVVSPNAAIVADRTDCATALRVAELWHGDLADGYISSASLVGERFFPGGPFRFARLPYDIDEFTCRQRKIRQGAVDGDINEVWCRSAGGAVVGWRSVMAWSDAPRTPAYPTLGPEELRPRMRVPTLEAWDALRYLRLGLRRYFGDAFTMAYGRELGCVRVSRSRFRCSPSWIIGDGVYAGRARVWLKVEDYKVTWNYAWRITLTDELCVHLGRGNCRRTFVVR